MPISSGDCQRWRHRCRWYYASAEWSGDDSDIKRIGDAYDNGEREGAELDTGEGAASFSGDLGSAAAGYE